MWMTSWAVESRSSGSLLFGRAVASMSRARLRHTSLRDNRHACRPVKTSLPASATDDA